jgi:hypothetical protein
VLYYRHKYHRKEEDMENIEKKKRVRSPNYPVIALEKGIELVAALFKSQQRYPVSVEVAAKDWNISPKSSYLAQHVAAMSAYGLVDIEGEKESLKVKVSELAFKIIVDKRPDSDDRKTLIMAAALNPTIFRNIYDKYRSGLPSDHALQYELVTSYKFNPDAVDDFMKIMKQTFSFANVYESGIIGGNDKPAEVPDMNMNAENQKDIPRKSFIPPKYSDPEDERVIATYTIGRGSDARIVISGQRTTKESIEKFLKRLQEDKEYLIENIPEEQADPAKN